MIPSLEPQLEEPSVCDACGVETDNPKIVEFLKIREVVCLDCLRDMESMDA
jgi:hypothetical protein